MKLTSSATLLFALCACAHAPLYAADERIDATTDEGIEAIQNVDVAVTVRYGPDDAASGQQVRKALRVALPAAERWGRLSAPVVITIHPTHGALELAAHRDGVPWLRGWATYDSVELQSPRTWSRGAASDAQLVQLLTHELTHCAMFQALGRDVGARVAGGIPDWFREGMATSNAGQRIGPADRYASADRTFRLLVDRYGVERIRAILTRARSASGFADAFQQAIGIPLHAFERDVASQSVRDGLGADPAPVRARLDTAPSTASTRS